MDWILWLHLKYGGSNPFKNADFLQDRYDEIMARPPANRRYAIFFTPRSSSSRLTDLAKATGVLGHPAEFFNPRFVSKVAETLSARDLEEYVRLLVRFRNMRGAFGCELTYAHLVRMFGSNARFLSVLRPHKVIWLIRRDIVAQAVSVARMKQTSVTHSPLSSAGELARADQSFKYDKRQIRRYVGRLSWMERQTEAMIAGAGLEPLRLTYEDLTRSPAQEVLTHIGSFLGSDPIPERTYESAHQKIGGAKNLEFADRFRKEHPSLLARLDRSRAPMLEAHAASEITREKT